MSGPEFTYALANPLSVLLDKSPADFSRADFLKVIAEKRHRAHHLPLHGRSTASSRS